MKFCLDIQALQGDSSQRGIGRYSAGLAEAIIKSARVDPTLVLNTALHKGFDQAFAQASNWVAGDKIKIFSGLTNVMGLIAGDVARKQAAAALFEAYLAKLDIDVLHTAAPFDGMGDDSIIGDPRLGITSNIFRTCTIYDLIPFESPDIYLSDARYAEWYRNRLEIIKSYDLIFAISEHTRKTISEFGLLSPDRVVNISTDASPNFKQTLLNNDSRISILNKYGISGKFIMHTGILESRKNVDLILLSLAILPKEIVKKTQIVFVANATSEQKSSLQRLSGKLGLPASCLVFAGAVPDSDLVKLYNLTEALILPSKAEGFGLPLLEAMRCGSAVLGANSSSIPEVVGSKEYLFDPDTPVELAERLYKVLSDHDYLTAAREHALRQQTNFSWNTSAEKALDAIEARLSKTKPASKRTTIDTVLMTDTDSALAMHALGKIEADNAPPHLTVANTIQIPIYLLIDPILGNKFDDSIKSDIFAALIWKNKSNAYFRVSRELAYLCAGYSILQSGNDDHCHTKIHASQLINHRNIIAHNFIENDDIEHKRIEQLKSEIENKLTSISNIVVYYTPIGDPKLRLEVADKAIINLMPDYISNRLFVDITELMRHDGKSGIQRVVRNILREFLFNPGRFIIEPIYRDGDQYRFARSFTCKHLGIADLKLPDSYVKFNPGDTFLGLDLDALITPDALFTLRQERLRGLRVIWVLYDLLPLTHPTWFHKGIGDAVRQWLEIIAKEADRIIAISRSVADSFIECASELDANRKHKLEIDYWPLGADMDSAGNNPSINFDNSNEIAHLPLNTPTFLTVGTIEPRKGISKLIDGMEHFWARGGEAVCVLAGKQGWHVQKLVDKIKHHPEFGKRLFWYEGPSDQTLHTLYMHATAVILPSEGEGFGLPLVEAAIYNTPVIARRLPVFEEIGGEHAYYFDGSDIKFAEELEIWLDLFNRDLHPKPKFNISTWKQSARLLLEKIDTETPYHTIYYN